MKVMPRNCVFPLVLCLGAICGYAQNRQVKPALEITGGYDLVNENLRCYIGTGFGTDLVPFGLSVGIFINKSDTLDATTKDSGFAIEEMLRYRILTAGDWFLIEPALTVKQVFLESGNVEIGIGSKLYFTMEGYIGERIIRENEISNWGYHQSDYGGTASAYSLNIYIAPVIDVYFGDSKPVIGFELGMSYTLY